jgi:hypothetical protein
MGVLGFDSWRGLGIFIFTTASRTALRPTQPPIHWYQGLFPWGKAAGAWSRPLTISCQGQRMSGAIPPLPQYSFMAWRLIKAQRQPNLTLTLLLTVRSCEPLAQAQAQAGGSPFTGCLQAVSSISNPRTRYAVVTGTHPQDMLLYTASSSLLYDSE